MGEVDLDIAPELLDAGELGRRGTSDSGIGAWRFLKRFSIPASIPAVSENTIVGGSGLVETALVLELGTVVATIDGSVLPILEPEAWLSGHALARAFSLRCRIRAAKILMAF